MLLEAVKRRSQRRRMLLEEDDYAYNESNRKRVMTVYQVMKSLTGEMVSDPDLLSQAKF